jgi:hypothetical protein
MTIKNMLVNNCVDYGPIKIGKQKQKQKIAILSYSTLKGISANTW